MDLTMVGPSDVGRHIPPATAQNCSLDAPRQRSRSDRPLGNNSPGCVVPISDFCRSRDPERRSGKPEARLIRARPFRQSRQAKLLAHLVTAFVGLTRAPTFGCTCRLSSFGQHAESTVDRLAVGKHAGEVGLNQHQVSPSRRTAIVFAANAARQFRKIIFLSHVITVFSCRFLLHTAFARSVLQGARL